jgi:hypothetical protein
MRFRAGALNLFEKVTGRRVSSRPSASHMHPCASERESSIHSLGHFNFKYSLFL